MVAGMGEDEAFEIDVDTEACLAEWVAGLDVVATMVALSVDDAGATGEVTAAFLACNQDMIVSLMLEETGLTLEDLSEEEASCLREWVTDSAWTTLLTGATDDPSVLMGFVADLIACAPDMFISSMLEDGGITLEDLSEEEASCLRAWVADTDWTSLFTGSTDDPALLFDLLPGLFDCVPDLSWSPASAGPSEGVIEDATPVEIGVATQGELEYVGDRDFFSFGATEGQLYELDTTPGTLEGSVLDLFDADSNWLDGNDGYGDPTASRLIWLAPTTGTYHIQVSSFDAGTGTYTLTIALSDITDDHPNSAANATPAELGVATRGELEYNRDNDFFTFEATEGEYYQLDVTLGTLQDSSLDLFDADGIWLDGNDDYGGSTASRLIWLAPTTGTHHVQVSSFDAGTGTYTLTITVSDITDDHPNSAANATPAELGVAIQGELEYNRDNDFFTFEATEGEYYQLDVTHGTLEHAVVDIFDAQAGWLRSGHDYGNLATSRLIWPAPATGTYYVRVTGPGPGTYALTITVSDIVDDHPNGTDNATPVEIGVSTQGDLEYEGDVDYFAFEATEGQLYELDVTLGTLQDSVLDLFDTDGNWLDSNDDYGDSTASRLTWTAPGTGTYYVQVTGFGDGTGTYTLTIALSDIVDDHPNSAAGVPPVEVGVPTQGELEYEGDSDYFAFEAEEGQLYELDVTLGTLQDSVLDLFDTDGNWLDSNDDYGDSTASRLTWTAPGTGTYYVQVTSFGDGTGTYTLTIAIAL